MVQRAPADDAALADGAALANVEVAMPSAATAVKIKATPKLRHL
jgi:hypothetical protein